MVLWCEAAAQDAFPHTGQILQKHLVEDIHLSCVQGIAAIRV